MSAIFGFAFYNGNNEQQDETAAHMSSELAFRGNLLELAHSGEGSILGARHFSDDHIEPVFSRLQLQCGI